MPNPPMAAGPREGGPTLLFLVGVLIVAMIRPEAAAAWASNYRHGDSAINSVALTDAAGIRRSVDADRAPDDALDSENPTEVSESVIASVTDSVGMVRRSSSAGTAWVAGHGFVVTNYHVVDGSFGSTVVHFPDGRSVDCFTAVANRKMDLAVLRCDTSGRRPIRIDTRIPEPDTPIAVVGYPEAVGPITTTGMILSDRRVIRGIETVGFTAQVYPGSSGSPIFDASGNVRAVVAFGGESGGFGVPIEKVRRILATAESYPSTKVWAQWRLRLLWSAPIGGSTFLIAWFFARRYGRLKPWKEALRWMTLSVFICLLVQQILFYISEPTRFI